MASILKNVLAAAYLVCASMLALTFFADSFLHGNHYTTLIMIVMNAVILATVIFITYKRVKKISAKFRNQ